jgi:hypothetical protein
MRYYLQGCGTRGSTLEDVESRTRKVRKGLWLYPLLDPLNANSLKAFSTDNNRERSLQKILP